MAITTLEPIYVVEMTNIETDVTTTLPSAYVSLEDAYAFVDECKRTDERVGTTECWTYRVRPFTLFR